MSSRSDLVGQAWRGAVEGLAATGVMSLVIAGGHALGLLTTPPPKQITEEAAEKSGVRDDVTPEAFTLGWLAAHAGYGAASGILFRLTRRWLPESPAVAGVLFGSAVWGASYLGLMPALGLYPWPKDDRPSRTAVMIAAHFVFGGVTAAADELLARGKRPSKLERLARLVGRG